MKKAFIQTLLACSLAAAAAAPPAFEPLPDGLRLLSRKGIDAVYAVEPAEAEKEFRLALRKYPGHPFPHFGLALAKWAEFEYLEDESSPALAADYAALLDTAQAAGEKWLEAHPGDANACLCLGGIYGLRARQAGQRHRWLKAYLNGRKAVSITRRALRIAPGLYDAYLGLGLYEYYAGMLPGVVKVLARLMVSGNAETGLRYLALCRDKGDFNALAARLFLLDIRLQPGPYSDPALALKWARELRAEFPNQPQMRFLEILALYADKKYGEARAETLAYLRAVQSGKPGYRRRFLPRVYTALGAASLAEKKYDEAAVYFARGAATLKDAPGQPPSRWGVWALVKLGNVYDLKGMRARALEYYREAGAYRDDWGFSQPIGRYLDKPFTEAELPGRLGPPQY